MLYGVVAVFFASAVARYVEDELRWDDSDLIKFVTRPDLRPPKLLIGALDQDLISPGYIFLAPYSCIGTNLPITTYITQQVGPKIYDTNGELVWSGSGSLFHDWPVFDFKAVSINDSDYLSLIAPRKTSGSQFTESAAYILNSSYQEVVNITFQGEADDISLDIHEFTVLNQGDSCLITYLGVSQPGGSHDPGPDNHWNGRLYDDVFQEIDLHTSEKIFEWRSVHHISSSESTYPRPGSEQDIWDYLHVNSIEKTDDDNYLVSARNTDAIYLVSGLDGHVLWRLGGKRSDFVLEGFNFSRQHDARVRSQNETTTIISFLDNATDDRPEHKPTSSASALLVIALHTSVSPMVATLLHRYERPDGHLSIARGNMQLLPTGNWFAGWGDDGYITEHTAGGEVVFAASFASQRFVNYRAFKLPFTSNPVDKPVVKAFASTTARKDLTTVIYVSWDGATEVVEWRFFSAEDGKSSPRYIGSTWKEGFETAFVSQGFHAVVFAEAIDVYGRRLAISHLDTTEIPLGWNSSPSQDSEKFDGTRNSFDSPRTASDYKTQIMSAFVAGLTLMFCLLKLRG